MVTNVSQSGRCPTRSYRIATGVDVEKAIAPRAPVENEDEPAAPEPPQDRPTPRSAWGDFFEDTRNRTLFDTDPA